MRIALVCEECHNRNYHTTRPRTAQTERLALSKFCRHCGQHTKHKESK